MVNGANVALGTMRREVRMGSDFPSLRFPPAALIAQHVPMQEGIPAVRPFDELGTGLKSP